MYCKTENWKRQLKKDFPGEDYAIDKYFELVYEYSPYIITQGMLKIMPLWLSKFICKTPLLYLFTNLWNEERKQPTLGTIHILCHHFKRRRADRGVCQKKN